MSVLRILVCVAVVCVVPTLAQRSRFPSQFEIKVALNNPETVDKALRCIEGRECKLPYGELLRRAGPELVTFGRCPPRLCHGDQEQKARQLILEIQRRYPKRFYATVNRLAQRRHFGR